MGVFMQSVYLLGLQNKRAGHAMPGVRIFSQNQLGSVLFVGAWRSRSCIGAGIAFGASVLIAAREHPDETQQCYKGY
jgi:hypothetical protein